MSKVGKHLSDMQAVEIIPYAQVDSTNLWETTAAIDILEELGSISQEEINYYEDL